MQNTHLHHRRSIRLPGYDYSQPGAYFITLVAYGRERLFGVVEEDRVRLNPLGRIVRDEWLKTPSIRKEIELDAFIVMPNHFHAIVIINDVSNVTDTDLINLPLNPSTVGHPVGAHSPEPCGHPVGATGRSPLPMPFIPNGPKPKSLGTLVAGFKSAVTNHINLTRNTPGVPVWQRNYYEHIITSDREYEQIDAYINHNPINWASDAEYS